MLQSIDLTAVQRESEDVELLRSYLQQLVGQPFLHFRFSYGDELSLHFGRAVVYNSPHLKHLVKGSYIVGARASAWSLRTSTPPSIVLGDDRSSIAPSNGGRAITKEQVESGTLVKDGAYILAAEPIPMESGGGYCIGIALRLLLSDGCEFFIRPAANRGANADDGPADWEIFTPHDRFLKTGPGYRWSYLDSRAAASSAASA